VYEIIVSFELPPVEVGFASRVVATTRPRASQYLWFARSGRERCSDMTQLTGAQYYRARLAGERLRRCYEEAPGRIQRYLEAEIEYVGARVEPGSRTLELGCGYGRVLRWLVQTGHRITGIDTAVESLELARRLLAGMTGWTVAAMDAAALGLGADSFDAVVCVQNGICAFRADRRAVFQEAFRVVRPGGLVLFSTYADAFWPERLRWFELQAREGLVGPIDYQATHRGEIVCADGFRSGTLSAIECAALCASHGQPRVVEVDESSVFFEMRKRAA
jgi:2-polyprenyl-6-hydroxyphenyl methylase/3-demethylubiquinone-9 3-methyltransferase